MKRIGLVLAMGLVGVLGWARGARAAGPTDEAGRLRALAGVGGGLVVQVGCPRPGLPVALAAERFVVQALDTDAARVAAVRELAAQRRLGGRVTATTFDGRNLPYTDGLVNLLVVVEPGGVPRAEMLRVLAPGGVACVADGGRWEKFARPRPGDIDEWTHYLHGPDNNAVARDTVVGPPRHTQWLAGPLWTRNHHRLNSISSVVTAAGRLFCIVDEATAANASLPGKWAVVARDAFSGVRLWRRAMKSWASQTIRFRSGPPQVTRLLVASAERLYVPLGLNEPVSALDAGTGKVLRTFAETAGAEEIVLAGDTLLVLKGAPVAAQAVGHPAFRGKYVHPNRKSIVALDAATGRKRWEWSAGAVNPRPETLASDGRAVYFQLGEAVMCLSLRSGERKWLYGELAAGGDGAKAGGKGKAAGAAGKKAPRKRRPSGLGFGRYVLVVADGVVLCRLGTNLTAIDAAKGTKLWDCPSGLGFHAPPDVFVINGIVWQGVHPSDSVAPPPTRDFNEGRDLHTGEVRYRNRIMVDLQTAGHHHRCYREKATVRYILTGKRGVEMMDLAGENHSRNNWVRGTCQYGILPANGLLYAPSHSCGCYSRSLLKGFWALAAERPVTARRVRPLRDPARRVKGPAFGQAAAPRRDPQSSDWPQYRHDALRSGVASTVLPAALKPAWTARIGGRVTQPVVAGGRVVLAAVDAGTVYALDEKTGRVLWRRTVGGRVDSPPALDGGRVLFGSADGWVYCLRAADGELVWRFQAAPADLRTVAFEQVESLWPASGSVLLLNGVVYVSAGRSSWLDGGIALYGLDPATGEVLHCSRLTGQHPGILPAEGHDDPKYNSKVAQNLTDYRTYLAPDRSDSFAMAAGAVNDVLTSDGMNVFLHQTTLDAALRPMEAPRRHLFSTSNLLDGSENHRSHWFLGSGDFSKVAVAYSWIVNGRGRWGSGQNVPVGLMMTFTDSDVWIARRMGDANGRYALLRRPNRPLSGKEPAPPDFQKSPGASGNTPPTRPLWQVALPARPRALIRSGGRLILGCVPLTAPADDPHAPYEGRTGGEIRIVSAEDGKDLARYPLDAAVVWDGLAAAGGRLFVSTADGAVRCWEAK